MLNVCIDNLDKCFFSRHGAGNFGSTTKLILDFHNLEPVVFRFPLIFMSNLSGPSFILLQKIKTVFSSFLNLVL